MTIRFLKHFCFVFVSFVCWPLTLCRAQSVAGAESKVLYTSRQMVSCAFNCIAQDQRGFLWIGTENGLDRFDGYRFTHYLSSSKDSMTISDNDVVSLLTDSQSRLWVGTNNGVSQYDYASNRFLRIPLPGRKKRTRVTSMVEDRQHNLLFCTAGYGIYVLRNGADALERLECDLTDDAASGRILMDAQQHVWVAGYAGTTMKMQWDGKRLTPLHTFRLKEGSIHRFIDDTEEGFLALFRHTILRFNHSDNSFADAGYDLSAVGEGTAMLDALRSRHGNLLLATDNGVWDIAKGSRQARRVPDDCLLLNIHEANVTALLEDRSGNLWQCCHSKGLYQLDQKRHDVFRNLCFSHKGIVLGGTVNSIAAGKDGEVLVAVRGGVYRFTPSGQIVKCALVPKSAEKVYRDRQGNYWLTTNNTLYAYDPYSGKAVKRLTMPGYGVMCIADNGQGELYVCNFGLGFTIYNVATGQSHAVESKATQTLTDIGLNNTWILSMMADRDGRLWLGTSAGLECFDTKTRRFIRRDDQHNVLSDRLCRSIAETADGHLLVGTRNGLFSVDREKLTAEPFADIEGLADLSICNIVPDAEGNIWLGTTSGLCQLKRDTSSAYRLIRYALASGSTTDECVACPPLVTADGLLTFATLDGITQFAPKDVGTQMPQIGSVSLTNVFVNGELWNSSGDFVFSHDQNTLSLEFSLLDFHTPLLTDYQYSLDGGNRWYDVTKGTNALNFANLAPGTYHLQVRAGMDGAYSEPYTLTLQIKSPWYATTLAYIIYTVAALALIVFGVRLYINRRRKEMDEAKMRFLINATHEIRSPLTLILDPLRNLKARVTDKQGRMDIDTIERSANRLLMLVNDILDIRKIDKKQMTLRYARTEMVNYVGVICSIYRYSAAQKDIRLRFYKPTAGEVYAWIDRANFDKIITNLLTNALKYTPDGGYVGVKLESDSEKIVIKVSDSGSGLPEGNPNRLFDRFYQGDNANTQETRGSGIGLNLCKTLVEMHGGTIVAANREDDSGAVFTVTVPLGNSHLKPEEIVSETEQNPDSADKAQKVISKIADITTGDLRKRKTSRTTLRILIADDDEDLLEYLTREFKDIFSVTCCTNGKEALELVLRKKFDVLISDVIMPEMDGIQMLRKIRGNPRVCDQPIILLTSKSEATDRLSGIQNGADAYLTKPFSIVELQAVVENLIDNRRRSQGKYSGAHQQSDRIETIEVKGNNEQLMDRIMKTVNEHLSDPNFHIEDLAATVGLSRVQLHRKMKEMTGLPSGQFLRNLRMEQAARLIKENKMNIAQVAYLVGFSSTTHFSTAFKNYFGVMPKEYAENKQ